MDPVARTPPGASAIFADAAEKILGKVYALRHGFTVSANTTVVTSVNAAQVGCGALLSRTNDAENPHGKDEVLVLIRAEPPHSSDPGGVPPLLVYDPHIDGACRVRMPMFLIDAGGARPRTALPHSPFLRMKNL
jgi:hypothetical protein